MSIYAIVILQNILWFWRIWFTIPKWFQTNAQAIFFDDILPFSIFYRKGNNFVVAGLTRPGYWYGIQLPTNPNVHSGWFEKVTLALQQYVQKNFHWSGQYKSIAVLIRKIHHNRRSGGLCCNNHQLMLVFSHLLSRII